jgi:hypothetical protein
LLPPEQDRKLNQGTSPKAQEVQGGSEGIQAEVLLREIAKLELSREKESKLVKLAVNKDERLRPGVTVPTAASLLPPEDKGQRVVGSEGIQAAVLLREISQLELSREIEGKLVTLAVNKDERLLALYCAFGGNKDRDRFVMYATQLVENDKRRLSDVIRRR